MKITTTLDQTEFKPFSVTIEFEHVWEARELISTLEEVDDSFNSLIKAIAKGL